MEDRITIPEAWVVFNKFAEKDRWKPSELIFSLEEDGLDPGVSRRVIRESFDHKVMILDERLMLYLALGR